MEQKAFWTCVAMLALLAGCQSIAVRKELDATGTTLAGAGDVCEKYRENELLAVQKCFPLVDNKPLVVSLRTVESVVGQVVLQAEADELHRVWCEPSDAVAKQIAADPASMEIGGMYVMSGTLERFSGGGLRFFHLRNCRISKWTPPPEVTGT